MNWSRLMPEVTPYPKSVQTRGTPGSNRWCPKTGALHADCDCIVSRNKRNRDGGLDAQRRDGKQLAKALGKPTGKLNNEETTNWPIRWEEKSGKLAEGVWKFYTVTKAQADAATPIGSAYPFVGVAANEFEGLAVLKISDLKNLLNEVRRGF